MKVRGIKKVPIAIPLATLPYLRMASYGAVRRSLFSIFLCFHWVMPWCLQRPDVDPASRWIFLMTPAAATLIPIVSTYDFDGGCCDPIQIHFLLQFSTTNFRRLTYSTPPARVHGHWVQTDGVGHSAAHARWISSIRMSFFRGSEVPDGEIQM